MTEITIEKTVAKQPRHHLVLQGVCHLHQAIDAQPAIRQINAVRHVVLGQHLPPQSGFTRRPRRFGIADDRLAFQTKTGERFDHHPMTRPQLIVGLPIGRHQVVVGGEPEGGAIHDAPPMTCVMSSGP